MNTFDVVIVGAGAAGLFCAGVAGQRGLRVLLIDHSEKIAEKVRISGGGRSNFTNRDLDISAPHKHFLGANPKFCRSALSRYMPKDFINLVKRYNIPFEEKHKGQLFCQRSADDLIQMLLRECAAFGNVGQVMHWYPCTVQAIRFSDGAQYAYQIDTSRGIVHTKSVVIATGGLSIPKIGATDFGFRIANQFNVRLVEQRPGLVPLIFDGAQWAPYMNLAGLSLPVKIETGSAKNIQSFDEDLLFTHRGLSGPAILQISSYWRAGETIRINLAPEQNLFDDLLKAKQHSKKLIVNELGHWVPNRLAAAWINQDIAWQGVLMEARDKSLLKLAQAFSTWSLAPSGSEGYRKAEVTVGGVDTRDISQQSMESKQPGLYFIGEVLDVTGWLGGYNFQWAWSSAYVCAQALTKA